MTVIAYDGKNIAVDRQLTSAYGIKMIGAKYHILPDGIVIGVGDTRFLYNLLNWLKDKTQEYPNTNKDNFSSGSICYVFNDTGIWAYTSDKTPFKVELSEGGFFVSGIGGDVALGALASGKTALEAALIACTYVSGCGCGVDVIQYKLNQPQVTI